MAYVCHFNRIKSYPIQWPLTVIGLKLCSCGFFFSYFMKCVSTWFRFVLFKHLLRNEFHRIVCDSHISSNKFIFVASSWIWCGYSSSFILQWKQVHNCLQPEKSARTISHCLCLTGSSLRISKLKFSTIKISSSNRRTNSKWICKWINSVLRSLVLVKCVNSFLLFQQIKSDSIQLDQHNHTDKWQISVNANMPAHLNTH